MKRNPIVALIISFVITILLSIYINKNVVRGAQIGGEGISKSSKLKANYDTDNYYWTTYPSSLLIAVIVGIIIFVVAYFLTPKKL